MSEMHPVKGILLGAAGVVDDAFGSPVQADNEEVITTPLPGDRLLDEHRVVIALKPAPQDDATE